MITPEIIGKNLVNARSDKGYTQKELADKLAVSPQNVSKWERGVSVPDVITLLQLADILNKDIMYFLDSHYQKEVAVTSPEPPVPTVVQYVDSVFNNANWYKQRISDIKRNGVYLFNSVMRYAEFSSLEMEYCRFKDCELFHCSNVNSQMNDVEIKHCFFRFMKVRNLALSSCKINASFYRCEISDSSFSATVFDNCNMDVVFDNCKFSRIAVKNVKKARHCTFENCEMDKMSEQIFRECGATIINCTIMED